MSKRKNTLETDFLHSIRELIVAARSAAVRSIDTIQVFSSFEIGCRIVEKEQKGEDRAEYGKQIINELSSFLSADLGKGFSQRNLRNMRRCYLIYEDRYQSFKQKYFADNIEYSSNITSIWQTSSAKLNFPFKTSWSNYIFLSSISDNNEREFYEIETDNNSWSFSELKRQFNSGLYERLAMSRDKAGVSDLSKKGQIIEKPEDLIKEPYVLEFLGLDEKHRYSESDLETAIIDKLEHFLLELGKGFLFEARQKRFTYDEEHYFIDLVLYNRILRCYVLIDLKIGKLSHQDLGQMQMYANYFDRHVKLDSESPTIGIILCKKKSEAIVEITLPKKSNIKAAEYKLYLPSKEQLKNKLLNWIKNN